MTKEEAAKNLMTELEKGWRYGEEEGWLSPEDVRAHFAEKPFNAETEAALLEAEKISTNENTKGYTDMDELFAALKD